LVGFRRIAKSLLDARRFAFVSIDLDPDLPPKKMYSNLRQLGVINKVEVEVHVERMNQFFVTRSLPQNELDFDIPVRIASASAFLLLANNQRTLSGNIQKEEMHSSEGAYKICKKVLQLLKYIATMPVGTSPNA
jgi:hypothetical protein